jgi:hypothetical protein
MKPPSSLSSRADVLTFLRNVHALAPLAPDEDTALLLAAGITPIRWLKRYCEQSNIEYPELALKELTQARWGSQKRSPKVLASPKYLRPNQHSRVRPIESAYDSDRPELKHGINARYKTSFNISGRDWLMVWYAAANQAATAAKGASYGLWTILQFMRRPAIQRAFRRWKKSKGQPNFKLPEDARNG